MAEQTLARPRVATAEPPPTSGRAAERRRAVLLALAGPLFVLALLATWELLSQRRLINPVLFPPVSTILGRFVGLWVDGTFPTHLLATLRRMLLGYALAAAAGISLGTLMGYSRGIYASVAPLLELLRPLPPVAMIPPFLLILGIGDQMKVAVIVFGSLWPVLLNTIDGVRGVHPTIVEVARMYQFTTARTLGAVVLPSALPQIMAGLRTSLAIALIVSLVSEMIGTTQGLGFLVVQAQRGFRMADMYAGIVLLALLGYALNRGFLLLESRLLAWHHAQTTSADEG